MQKLKMVFYREGAIANYANNLTVDNCSFVKIIYLILTGIKTEKCMVELFITVEIIY